VGLPRLSVAIPTHDTRDLTLACLASLEAARGEVEGGPAGGGLEVVVVDDGSGDGTAEAVAGRFPSVRLLRRDEAGGFSVAANAALRAATGSVLLLLNSDTEVPAGSLTALLEALDRHPRLGIAGADLFYPDGSPQWSGGPAPTLLWLFGLASGLPRLLARLPGWRRLRPPSGSVADAGDGDAPRPVDWVTGAALAMRREAWDDAGPLDEGYAFYGQDLDLCLTAGQRGWGVAVVPGFRVLHHHGASVAGSGTGRKLERGHQDPEKLRRDLLRWAEKHRGAGWARWARWLLRAGAGLGRVTGAV
jgi:N-acetylglucosaminyl-diphospho-decaprenol L-rhamnosyltransferase